MSTIDRISIPELMNGRYFYIPAYQRGYRWTSKQVVDLLIDLFTYAKAPSHTINEVVDGDYYCLQPIVARRITDSEEKRKLKIPEEKDAWEIVDGQQRLTTIYILYKFLMIEKGIDDKKLHDEEGGLELYHLIYATRSNSSSFLQNLGGSYGKINNIDFFHMNQAYQTIKQWVNCDGDLEIGPYKVPGALKLCDRYNLSRRTSTVRDILWYLLNNEKGVIPEHAYGTVQFLWYEMDAGKDAIQEFRETNMNQIRLTNAELIKALFLRTLNNKLVSDQKQLERANQWESIENTLQDDTFWSFLNNRNHDLPSRIDFLFNLKFHLDELELASKNNSWEALNPNEQEEAIKSCVRQSSNKLSTKDFLFNYFNDKFDGLGEQDVANAIQNEWEDIMTIFSVLQDWYSDVICYNLIGLLNQFDGSKLPFYFYKFLTMKEDDSREQFKEWLKTQVTEQFNSITFNDGRLALYYPDSRIFNLLLLLNINHLNKQAEESKDTNIIHKFPFDVFKDKKWDIEHIDSFTSNDLDKDNDKKEWVITAVEDLQINDDELNAYIENEEWDKAIIYIKYVAKENEVPDESKNHISNLTLLDAETNRSYGNSLFVTKRKRIMERIIAGKFVPTTTTYVFMKLFDEKGTSRSIWGESDMEKYHEYICTELKDYLPSPQTAES